MFRLKQNFQLPVAIILDHLADLVVRQEPVLLGVGSGKSVAARDRVGPALVLGLVGQHECPTVKRNSHHQFALWSSLVILKNNF
jgi:hypothetical protein